MTLARRIILKTAILTAALAAVGVGILSGMLAIQELVADTCEEFDKLHNIRHVDRQVQVALREHFLGNTRQARDALSAALAGLGEFQTSQMRDRSEFDSDHAKTEADATSLSEAALRDALRCFEQTDKDACTPAIGIDLHRASTAIGRLADDIEHSVSDIQVRTAMDFESTTWYLLALASVVVSLVVGVLHYHSVMGPLRELRDGTDRLAQRELGVRLESSGDREFFELKESFNHMAAELESLCNNLEERVTLQSKELAVAERLASVGFLAAGVAHEVNNPLAIIAGYAESLLRRIRRSAADAENSDEWVDDLEAIREEAFRCKRITQNLLDLSRMGDSHREPVSLRAVTEACISLVGSWTGCGDTRIELQLTDSDTCMVHASEQEMRQVVLNLLTNAVESGSSQPGHVIVHLARISGWVQLRVKDNGCGMSTDTLDRAFEPFFTTGKGRRGLGLGLSISHAIAQRQDGTLTARSDGPGRGSEFILRVPIHQEINT